MNVLATRGKKPRIYKAYSVCGTVMRYGSKLHVRKTWEINVEAIQARADQ